MSQKLEPERRDFAATRLRRRWLFRLAALVLGLSPLLALEGLCRVFDWGRPALHDDPFVGFDSIRPLFVLSDDGTRYEIPPARESFFRPDSFPSRKTANEHRIFCLGGSTVQGRPFAIETSFTSWLEISLNAAEPERMWNVVNCGGVSYASYRLIPILREVLAYEPDLIILYTGHNEFLEARTFEHIADRGRLVNAALAAASRLRTFTLIREEYLRLNGKTSVAPPEARPLLPTEVEALLDYQGGMEAYERDDAWRSGVIEQFRYNVHLLVRMAQDAGVEVVIVNPVSNVRDCPPFKSLHRNDLSPHEQEHWESLCSEAGRLMTGDRADLRQAIALLEQACKIDPDYASAFYHLGQCYLTARRNDDARRMLDKARELDVCPLRILWPMNEAVREVAHENGIPLVDAQALFEGKSRDGLVGDQWLVDHVHPSIDGHQLLADALANELVEMNIVSPTAEWADVRQTRYREHFESLPDVYFLKGMQRLEAVTNWARGRATRLHPGDER